MPYARTDDRIKIYYEEHGPTETIEARPPLVLAYGIGGNADLWDVNVAALAARRRLVLWEPRGHARSDSPDDPARYSFARWALDLKAVLDHLRIRRAHVGGLSLGAGIATRFTLAFPGRVHSLLVTNSSSAVGLPLSVENIVMRARSIEVTLTKGMDAMAEFSMAANPNVANRLALDPSSKDEFYAYYRRLTPIGYANSLRALLAMDHITDRLSELRVPVLLIGGDRDPSLGPMRVMHRKVRGSKLVVLSPASHFANRDQPQAWNRAAVEFLERCDAAIVRRGAGRRGRGPTTAGGEAKLEALLAVDDGRVLRVKAEDVERLVVHVMNSCDAAVGHGRRDASVSMGEHDDAHGRGAAHLRLSCCRSGRHGPSFIEGKGGRHGRMTYRTS